MTIVRYTAIPEAVTDGNTTQPLCSGYGVVLVNLADLVGAPVDLSAALAVVGLSKAINVTLLTEIPAGTAVIGKVGIDQTTPGTTNAVQIASGNTGKATYMASGTFTPDSNPTDMVIIEGSATKTVRVLYINLSTTNTAAGSQEFLVIKRSAADTTGTFVAATKVPLDSANAAATVNRVGHFTANPGALGAAVGTIVTKRVASPAVVPGSFAGVKEDAGVNLLEDILRAQSLTGQAQGVVLRGVAQTLAVNFAGAAKVAGQIHSYDILWTEE